MGNILKSVELNGVEYKLVSDEIGTEVSATGDNTLAQGYQTTAQGKNSIAGGRDTYAGGDNSSAIGFRVTALGFNAHAEGESSKSFQMLEDNGLTDVSNSQFKENLIDFIKNNQANKFLTNAFGGAFGNYSHSEGQNCIALGGRSHAEGWGSIALKSASHAEGKGTIVGENALEGQHVGGLFNQEDTEGKYLVIIGNGSMANEANQYKITRSNAYTLDKNGNGWFAGNLIAQQGNFTKLTIDNNLTAEQGDFKDLKINGNAIALKTDIVDFRVPNTTDSFILGSKNQCASNYSVAVGGGNKINGGYGFAAGLGNVIGSGSGSFIWGSYCSTAGAQSMAGGFGAEAKGGRSISLGLMTRASNSSTFVIGKGNKDEVVNGITNAFIIGNSNPAYNESEQKFELDDKNRSNAFRVDYSGNTYAKVNNSVGADYAEYFEWEDQNLNKEDRIGLFVSIADGEKIKIAAPGEEIIGIVSGTAGVIGDAHEDSWKNMYETDIYGRVQYETVTVPSDMGEITETRMKINPNYDSSEKYIPRSMRAEWDIVGLMGKLIVRDDGTCEVNGKCTCGLNGVATMSITGYRVLKRLDDSHILILMK